MGSFSLHISDRTVVGKGTEKYNKNDWGDGAAVLCEKVKQFWVRGEMPEGRPPKDLQNPEEGR